MLIIFLLVKTLLTLIILLCLKILRPPKLKFGDRIRVTKYKNIFAKDYTKH